MTENIISVEKVLNSRCSGDTETGPSKVHWSTFNNQQPQKTVMNYIINCCNIPRFSNGKLLHWFKNGDLYLGFEKSKDAYTQRAIQIESGMQHEAVYLACAAQGVGTCIHDQGINGKEEDDKTVTARHVIMEISEPYESGKFTTKAPGPEKPFLLGKNLTPPLRDSNVECIPLLDKLTSHSKTGSQATEKQISQLLWAARGRTPHGVCPHKWKLMWGLTIPTAGGVQDITSVYLVKENKLFQYINWTKEFSLVNRAFRQKLGWTRGNPIHDLRFIKKLTLDRQFEGANAAIIFCRNEITGRSLWEVGYMLENTLLQAKSLDISFESRILNDEAISQLNKQDLPNAVATVLL
jgi:hypothetical protein